MLTWNSIGTLASLGVTDPFYTGGNQSCSYTHDDLTRVASANCGTPWSQTFSYDAFGNLTKSGTISFQPTYSYLTNRMTQIGSSTPTYDANGNMTNDGVNALVYDGENRVTSSSGSPGVGAYLYDGNGLRVKKCLPNCTSPTATTVYVFSGSKVIAEYDNGAAPGSPSREYVYLGSQLLVKFEGTGTTYYHPDHLSNRSLSDASGNSAGQRGHFPFGETWYETGTTTKMKFTSYERDSESNNDYAMARFDVNRLGRFLTADPLSGSMTEPQSLNRYSYALNDPINLGDPSGAFIAPQLYALLQARAESLAGWLLLEESAMSDPFSPFGRFGEGPFDTPQIDLDLATIGMPWAFGCKAGDENFACSPGTPANCNPEFGCAESGGREGGGGGSSQQIRDIIKRALEWPNLASCLNKIFGPGTILTNSNLPYLDATHSSDDLARLTSRPSGTFIAGTPQQPVPASGRGTVLLASQIYDNSMIPYTQSLVYLHETANILACQKFTNVPYMQRPYMGPLGGPPSAAQQANKDNDVGQQLQECLEHR